MKLVFSAVVAMMAIVTTSTAFAQTGQACGRACLLGIADAYFAALAAHDPAKAPMAPDAKFTEQTRELKIGEGLWTTTTEGPTAFGKIHEIEAMGFTLPRYSKNRWRPFLR